MDDRLQAIKIKDDCEAAAVLLGLDDNTATTNAGSSRKNRPQWCYWDTGRSSLQFNPAGRKMASSDRPAICTVVLDEVAAAGSTGPDDAGGISDANDDSPSQPYLWAAVIVFMGTAIVLAIRRHRRQAGDANMYQSGIQDEEPTQWEQPLIYSKTGRRAQQGVRTPAHSETGTGISRYSSTGSGSSGDVDRVSPVSFGDTETEQSFVFRDETFATFTNV